MAQPFTPGQTAVVVTEGGTAFEIKLGAEGKQVLLRVHDDYGTDEVIPLSAMDCTRLSHFLDLAAAGIKP